MGGDNFYIGPWWFIVFFPLALISLIAGLIWKFTGSLISYYIAHIFIVSISLASYDLYVACREKRKDRHKNKEH
jgi:membrane protease YdiL (CAAX protease family)